MTVAYLLLSAPSSQAERAEAISISAELEDGFGSDSGRRPEHRHGLGGETEGGAALVCVREAVLHQRAGAGRAHELLTPAVPSDRRRRPSLFWCYMAACTCEDPECVFDAGLDNSGLAFVSLSFIFSIRSLIVTVVMSHYKICIQMLVFKNVLKLSKLFSFSFNRHLIYFI